MDYISTFYKIVDKFINLLSGVGYKQISYGTPKDLDLSKKQSNYPLAHIIFNNGSNDIKITTLNFTIIVADKIDNTPNSYLKYGKNNVIDVQQDLLVKTQSVLKQIDRRYLEFYDSLEIGYEILYNTTFDAFYEDYPELLSGFVFTFQLNIPNMIDVVCETTTTTSQITTTTTTL